MNDPIRTAEALQDEAFQRAHIREQARDWQMIAQELRGFIAFAFVAFVGVYALLSIGGM